MKCVSLEKQEFVLIKIYLRGGALVYYRCDWAGAQRVMQDWRFFLKFKLIPFSEWKKVADEKFEGKEPYTNYFFQRTEDMTPNTPVTGDLDGVLDFLEIAAISISEIPIDHSEQVMKEQIAMNRSIVENNKTMVELMKKQSGEGDEWRKDNKDGD